MNKDLLDFIFSRGAAYLDIETLGKFAGNPITQIGYYAPATEQTVFDPAVPGSSKKVPIPAEYFEAIPRPQSIEQDEKFGDPIRRARSTSYVRNYESWPETYKEWRNSFAEEQLRDPKSRATWEFLETGEIAPTRRLTIEGTDGLIDTTVTRDVNRQVKHIVEELITSKFGNKIIWIANANFEAKHLGAFLSDEQIEKLKGFAHFKDMKRNDFLLVNDPTILRAEAIAKVSGDYSGMWAAMKEAARDMRGFKVMDPFDVIKATQSLGLKVSKEFDLGIDFKDVTRAIKIEILARIMHDQPEIHSGLEDDILTERISKKVAEHAEVFEDLLANRPVDGKFTARQQEAIN